jgi:hypothetical protein
VINFIDIDVDMVNTRMRNVHRYRVYINSYSLRKCIPYGQITDELYISQSDIRGRRLKIVVRNLTLYIA